MNWLVLQSNMQINSNTHIQYLHFFPQERNHAVITVLRWLVVPLFACKKKHTSGRPDVKVLKNQDKSLKILLIVVSGVSP